MTLRGIMMCSQFDPIPLFFISSHMEIPKHQSAPLYFFTIKTFGPVLGNFMWRVGEYRSFSIFHHRTATNLMSKSRVIIIRWGQK